MTPRAPLIATGLTTETAGLGSGLVEYRLHRAGPQSVVVFHGGHMPAATAVGEAVFREDGRSVLVPSRPGYGRSDLATGPGPEEFADTTAALCRHLGIGQVAGAVGISAGGPYALAMAARHPELVHRVVLISAVGPFPWPDAVARAGARIGFHPALEAGTWLLFRALLRTVPLTALRAMMASLSTLPPSQVLDRLPREHKATLVRLFAAMRSGKGFLNDLSTLAEPSIDPSRVVQPALVIATRNDRSVPFAHAEGLVERLPEARLVESTADSHLLWFSPDYPSIEEGIRAFLNEQ